MQEAGFTELVFADNSNAFKEYASVTKNEEAFNAARTCQEKVHSWGRANQVSFEPTKESFHVVSHIQPEGEDFKVLGVTFDCELKMAGAVQKLVNEVRWKVKTLLRSAQYHTVEELVTFYKSKVLGFIEYRTPAIDHATDTVLKKLDAVQKNFLKDVGLTEKDALLNWNLAPLETRRDIAMLGLLHRTALGKGPKHFARFFRLSSCQRHGYWTRLAERRHCKQLDEVKLPNCPELQRRSALGFVAVYNRLPAEVVSVNCVKEYQKLLAGMVKERAAADRED